MENLLASNSLTSMEQLNMNLLSTLDESKFFNILTDFFKKNKIKGVFDCYLMDSKDKVKLILKNSKSLDNSIEKEIVGVMRMVSKNKTSYFSNNTEIDPLFVSLNESRFSKQMCIPFTLEGVILGMINVKRKSKDNNFERSDITSIMNILKEVSIPASNLLMFLEAKRLNTVLQKKIQVNQDSNNSQEVSIDNESERTFKLILRSRAMQRTKALADKLAMSNLSYTVEGELGTGKEFMARYVADKSSRKDKNFVIFDASTVDPILADVLLFGARRSGMPLKEGLISRANGGTLLIKNVFLLPDNVQRKLLNVIKEKVFTRLGEEQFRKVDVRIAVSSREPLSKFFEEGRLRQDFFYEIARVTLNVPSLLDRMDDIDELASLFLNRGRSLDEQKSFSPTILSDFRSYNWPGNIRELANLSERSYLLSEGLIIEKSGLEAKIASKKEVTVEDKSLIDENFVQTSLEEVEKEHICKTLEFLAGNKTKTAKSLGITVKTLYNKLHAYNLIEAKKV